MTFDLLTDVLNSMRIHGSTLLHEAYLAPWAISLPEDEKLGRLLSVEPGTRVVAFHLVQRGTMTFQSEEQKISVEPGEVIICFGGSEHQISQGHSKALPAESVLKGAPIHFRCPMGEGESTLVCLCGVFYLHDTCLNPLFASMPAILHTRVAQDDQDGLVKLIADELDARRSASNFMVQRLLELLCARAIRNYINTHVSTAPSWIAGIKDPLVNQAITAMHATPGAPWSVDSLAEHVALSPSRFAARFREVTGESPMKYLTRWRVQSARQQLRNSDLSVAAIGDAVGYDNQAAFIRAFKRYTGTTPGRWRAELFESSLTKT